MEIQFKIRWLIIIFQSPNLSTSSTSQEEIASQLRQKLKQGQDLYEKYKSKNFNRRYAKLGKNIYQNLFKDPRPKNMNIIRRNCLRKIHIILFRQKDKDNPKVRQINKMSEVLLEKNIRQERREEIKDRMEELKNKENFFQQYYYQHKFKAKLADEFQQIENFYLFKYWKLCEDACKFRPQNQIYNEHWDVDQYLTFYQESKKQSEGG